VLEVEVPARVEYVSLLRMLVSTYAASHSDLDDDRLDDLRLALSEACNLVVGAGGPGDRVLVVVCRDVPDALLLDVHDGRGTTIPEPGAVGALPAPEDLDSDTDLPLELIRALVDEVDRTVQDGTSSLRLTMRFAPPAA
jgi:anti-sigma regulatory factor (Ser/Thr protein kinase)